MSSRTQNENPELAEKAKEGIRELYDHSLSKKALTQVQEEVEKQLSSLLFKFPLVLYREKGQNRIGGLVAEQTVPAVVLTHIDDNPPHRRCLQVFTPQGDLVLQNVEMDKDRVGCWFPIPTS